MSPVLIVAIVLFIVGVVLAIMNRDLSPLTFIVVAGVFRYLFDGVL